MEAAQKDPFVAALTAALEEVVRRGVEVTPAGDGWLLRVANDEPRASGHLASDYDEQTQLRKAW